MTSRKAIVIAVVIMVALAGGIASIDIEDSPIRDKDWPEETPGGRHDTR